MALRRRVLSGALKSTEVLEAEQKRVDLLEAFRVNNLPKEPFCEAARAVPCPDFWSLPEAKNWSGSNFAMDNSLRATCWMCFGMTLGGTTVRAFEPSDLFLIQKGPTVLKPQFELRETFNDNVTFREKNQIADFITVVSPGLGFQVGSKEFNFLDLTYFYDRVIYADTSELSTDQHRFAMLSHWQKSRLTLDGNDRIEFLSSPIGGGISLAGQRVDRTTFADQYRLGYDFSEKTGLYLQARHDTTDYEKGVGLYDQTTLMGTVGFQYKALSRTYFFGELYYGRTEADANFVTTFIYPTANFIGMFLGAHGDFTEHLSGSAKIGYEHRFYSDDTEPLDAPVVEIRLEERFSEKTFLSAAYTRLQYESVQFVKQPYVTDSISADLLQQIGNDGRFRGQLNAAYISSAFDANGREDNMFIAGLTLTYDIKLWMRAFGSYNFEVLDTNETGQKQGVVNYTVNRITVGLKLGY